MKVKKISFRKNYTTVLLIIGFVLSCFVAVNVISLLNSIQSMQQSNNNSKYKHACNIAAYNPDDAEVLDDRNVDIFINKLRCIKGNLCLFGHFSFIGEGCNSPFTYISLYENEKIPMDVIWGRKPNKKEIHNKDNVIMVGTDFEQYIENSNGKKYIYLDTIKYKVTGIFRSAYQIEDKPRMDLFTYYDCIDSKMKKSIKSFTDFLLFFNYGSSVIDYSSLKKNVNSIKTVISKYGFSKIELQFDDDKNNNALLSAKIKLNKYFMYVTFGFTLINCMVISDVWIKKRYNEFVIRRTFGYSVIDMMKLLLKNLAEYGIISMGLGVLLQTVYAVILGKDHLDIQYIGENIIYLCIMLVIVVLITVLVPLINIRKILPAAEIRKQKM